MSGKQAKRLRRMANFKPTTTPQYSSTEDGLLLRPDKRYYKYLKQQFYMGLL